MGVLGANLRAMTGMDRGVPDGVRETGVTLEGSAVGTLEWVHHTDADAPVRRSSTDVGFLRYVGANETNFGVKATQVNGTDDNVTSWCVASYYFKSFPDNTAQVSWLILGHLHNGTQKSDDIPIAKLYKDGSNFKVRLTNGGGSVNPVNTFQVIVKDGMAADVLLSTNTWYTLALKSTWGTSAVQTIYLYDNTGTELGTASITINTANAAGGRSAVVKFFGGTATNWTGAEVYVRDCAYFMRPDGDLANPGPVRVVPNLPTGIEDNTGPWAFTGGSTIQDVWQSVTQPGTMIDDFDPTTYLGSNAACTAHITFGNMPTFGAGAVIHAVGPWMRGSNQAKKDMRIGIEYAGPNDFPATLAAWDPGAGMSNNRIFWYEKLAAADWAAADFVGARGILNCESGGTHAITFMAWPILVDDDSLAFAVGTTYYFQVRSDTFGKKSAWSASVSDEVA